MPLETGQNALLIVEKAPRPEQEPALTLPQLTVVLIVSVKAKKIRTAIFRHAQVIIHLLFVGGGKTIGLLHKLN